MKLNWFETPREFEAQNRTKVAEIELSAIFSQEEINKYWWQGANKDEAARPRVLYPFYVWDLEETFIRTEVSRLGLIPKAGTSPLITNNSLIPLMGIVDNIQLGYSSFEPEFAQMVREGKAQRNTWLHSFELIEYAAKHSKFIASSLDEILSRLHLTRQELKINS